MNVDITQIVVAVIGLCSAIITYAWNSSKRKDEALKWVKIAVAAAEQVFNHADGEVKKEAVLEYIQNKGYALDEAEVETAIEAAVLELHAQLYGKEKSE